MLKREIITTEDGSNSLFIPELKENYHSIHGALQESMHVFINAGIEYYNKNEITILEAGFGTALNAFLSYKNAKENNRHIIYHTIEKYPLDDEEWKALNYGDLFNGEYKAIFNKLHESEWDKEVEIDSNFTIHKHNEDLKAFKPIQETDIVFFDAFAPHVQPDLWTEEVFIKFYETIVPQGILTTYCVKGIVKQALRNVGFKVKRLPGPPGKREMLRATKINEND